MTEHEARVLELVIKWRDVRYAVEEALIRQELLRAVDLLKKERRDVKTQKSNDSS